MKYALTFSGMIRPLHEGKITLEEFEAFWFGCQRVHVLRTDGKIPIEVATRLNNKGEGGLGYPPDSEGTAVSAVYVEEGPLATWTKRRERIVTLDEQGKVKFTEDSPFRGKGGSFWLLARSLMDEGHEVWNGEWITRAHLPPAECLSG